MPYMTKYSKEEQMKQQKTEKRTLMDKEKCITKHSAKIICCDNCGFVFTAEPNETRCPKCNAIFTRSNQ